MAISPLTPTFVAQKEFGDFTAWRSTPLKMKTSSQLFNITQKALNAKENENAVSINDLIGEASDFYNDVKESLGSINNIFNNNDLQSKVEKLDTELFDLQSSVNVFQQALISAKSIMSAEIYAQAIQQVTEVQRLINDAKRNSGQDIQKISNIVLGQIEGIQNIAGGAGRKIASNVLNTFTSQSRLTDTDKFDALSDAIKELTAQGTLGQSILEEAEPIIGSAQELLLQARENFDSETEESKTTIKDTIGSVFSDLSNITRFLPSNIRGDISNVTQQITGIRSIVDRGLSAVKSDGSQLQPLAGRYGNTSNTRVSSQTFAIPKEFDPTFGGIVTPFVKPGSLDGERSALPSVFAQSVNSHPRRNQSNNGAISSPNNFVVPELSDMRKRVVEAYQKMPGDAVLNPELANGPSLLTNIQTLGIEQELVGNTRAGTTVADITSVVKTADQVFIPRFG